MRSYLYENRLHECSRNLSHTYKSRREVSSSIAHVEDMEMIDDDFFDILHISAYPQNYATHRKYARYMRSTISFQCEMDSRRGDMQDNNKVHAIHRQTQI